MLPTPPASPKPTGLCGPEDRLGHVLAGRIQLNGILGVGAYGTVYAARDIRTGIHYAVKALNKVGLDQRQRRFQDREIQLHLHASQHPNVVSMEKILDTPDCTYVVLEYCPEGDLFSRITEGGDYVGKEQKAKAVFLQILDAVQHCHSRGIYHRDLKPENILVKDEGWTVKLADFGLATQHRVTSDFGCGSTFYMSPECQSTTGAYGHYESAPNDVWSLGVVLVNLTCGRNPWKRASADDSSFRAFVRDPDFLRTILPISDSLNCILKRIFEIDPALRITLDELREYVVCCPAFGQDTTPITPPYSPVEKPVASPSVVYNSTLEPIPNIDPLPVQQFPSFARVQQQQNIRAHQPTPYYSRRRSPKVANPRQNDYYLYPNNVVAPSTDSIQIASFNGVSLAPWAKMIPAMVPQACWINLPVF